MTTANTSEIIESYAQQVVEDMDIEALMDAVKDNIIDRLEHLPENDALAEIQEFMPEMFEDEDIE